jgi:AcrR family transcriptional regulator
MARLNNTALSPKRKARKTERLSRGTLDRATVVAAALEIADRDGLASVTMARVAEALGAASPMSLYRHLHDKQALLDAIADLALSEVPALARDRRPWRVRLEEYAVESRRNALRHPALVEIVQQTWVRGSGGARVGLDIIALLRDAGFDEDSSIRAYMVFRNHIVGFLAWEISRFRRGGGEFAQQIADTFERSDTPVDSPLRRFSRVVGKDPEGLFLFGIGLLLDGFEVQLRRTRRRSGERSGK